MPTGLNEEKLLVIEMPYAKSDIVSIKGDTTGFKNAGTIFLDVICTDFPSTASLKQLNKKRVMAVLQRFPFLISKDFAKVNLFRQLDGAEKEKAMTMFHGLVIRYYPKQSPHTMEKEIAALEELIITIEKDTLIGEVKVKPPVENRDSILYLLKLKRGLLPTGPAKYETKPWDMSATGYDRTRRNPLDSQLVISPKSALKKGLITKTAYKAYSWTPWVTLYFRRIGDSLNRYEKKTTGAVLTVIDTLKEIKYVPIPDSTLLKIFSRVQWKNYTVVGDVTVSMYPYSAQLLLWIRLHGLDSVTHSFVFFNDGDEMPDMEKKIGSTGGIYHQSCETFEELKKIIKDAMEKGSGGDRPENDIEALLLAEKEFPGTDFQVLIADNRAPVKDKILSDKLIKPVRIILCGTNAYDINIDYLNLARQTKGSVHLIEQDINDLTSMHEGEILKIGKKEFKIENGFFVETATLER